MGEWAWRLGMLVLAGVPAIVGGGLMWHFFQMWTPVVIWEVVLLFLVSILIARGDKKARESHSRDSVRKVEAAH